MEVMKMNNVKSRTLGVRQIGNEGKLGFVPTSKEIVEMELSLIDFSEICQNDFTVNICDLSGGKGDQLNWMNEYLMKEGVESNVYYNELSEDRYNECVKRYPYMKSLNCDFFNIKVGAKINKALSKKVFSIIRNNPPYMYFERRGENVRAEVEFFIKNSLLDIDGAIHIMEVPIHQLTGIKNFISMICYRYEVFFAKFPEEVFNNYKQVACIMKKKAVPSQDRELVRSLTEKLINHDIPYLDEVNEKIFKVCQNDFKKAKPIDIFRENRISTETLHNGLEVVLDDLILAEKKSSYRKKIKKGLKPIIELNPGHLSQLLAAGSFNGLMGNLLIKGGVNKIKEINVVEEDGKATTTETEILKPYIELTSKSGQILARDF